MATIITLKRICLKKGNEYLKHCLQLIDRYVDKHSGAHIVSYISDRYIAVYDGDVLLLKISTAMLEEVC